MTWIEVIQIRASQNKTDLLLTTLVELIRKLREAHSDTIINLYRQQRLRTDYCLHLIHQSNETDPVKSGIGQILTATLREFGMVDHSVWVLEKVNQTNKNPVTQ